MANPKLSAWLAKHHTAIVWTRGILIFIGIFSTSNPVLWMAVLAILWAVWRYIKGQFPYKTKAIHTKPAHVWQGDGDFRTNVVGESHYQENLAYLAAQNIAAHLAYTPRPAILIPYSSNPRDKQAVQVTIDGLLVGHLGRADAVTYRQRLREVKQFDQAASCQAILTGGRPLDDGTMGYYGVKLDLPCLH